MTFTWPMLLWGLILVPLALAAYLLAQRRRARYAVRFTNLDLLANVVQRSPGWRRHVPAALYLTALAALVISLARPQAIIPVPRDEATVILVMDVSGSMEATDVHPDRLSAAQTAARSFVDKLPSGLQVGLVSFSSTAQLLAPPSPDRTAVRKALDGLRAGGGTAMGDGLQNALQIRRSSAMPAAATPTAPRPGTTARQAATPTPAATTATDDQPPMAIVLLSDGANTVGRVEPLEAANNAQRLGVPVFTIALGTPQGMLTVPSTGGQRRAMRVPPDERTLQQIAEVTGGRYFAAPTDEDLRAIYQELGSRIGFVEEQQEVTALFAAAGLALMALGGGMALFWFNRFP